MDGERDDHGVVIDDPGSGYSFAPGVAVRNGTVFDPIPLNEGGSLAVVEGDADHQLDQHRQPGHGLHADADGGHLRSDRDGSHSDGEVGQRRHRLHRRHEARVRLHRPGRHPKFVDKLPGLGPAAANNLGQYIPVAKSDTTTFPGSDYYEIAVVQYQERMHSDLPPTTQRGYVQLETSVVTGSHYPLPGGKFGVDKPHFLGPTIVAQKDRPVRIKFTNLLPTGAAGDLFLPTDSTIMGSGMGPTGASAPVDEGTVMDGVRNPLCGEDPKSEMCFKDNRATLHLHGGNTPWISDGTTAPVDHSGRGDHLLARGSQRGERPRHAGPRAWFADLLLHEPAKRPADVLPRPLVRHHPAQRVRR